MQNILNKLGIDETLQKKPKKEKVFTKIADNIPKEANYNYMADLLELPETKQGFKYLLVMVDLATHEFDIEPIKNKSANVTLDAMKKIFKRGILKKPYSSLQTDNGGEFMGSFHDFLYENNIYHARAMKDRHSQMSMVESLNRTLGRLFSGYMNSKEMETGKQYNQWDDVIDTVRKELNKHRKQPAGNTVKANYKFFDTKSEPAFKVGDVVHRLLDAPRDALGNEQPTKEWRMGDIAWETNPRAIKKIVYYSGAIPFRYILDGLPRVSFTDIQLKPSKEKESKFVVNKIIGRKQEKKIVYYLVWFKKELKKDATWLPKDQLIEDGFEDEIKEFEKENKKKSNLI